MDDINTPVIEEFRANGGAVDQAMGGFFKGKPLLILHHTAAKTGKLRMNPLVYALHVPVVVPEGRADSGQEQAGAGVGSTSCVDVHCFIGGE